MSTLEEVKKMQRQGLQEDQIVQNLQNRGVSYREISDALNQSKIRAAVEQPIDENNSDILTQTTSRDNLFPEGRSPAIPDEDSPTNAIPSEPKTRNQYPMPPQPPKYPEQQFSQSSEEYPGMEGMQQSILQNSMQENYPQQEEYAPGQEQYPQQQYDQNYDNYQSYDYASAGISPDVISEISEQIVSEKLMEIRKPLEKVIDFRNTIETKTEAIEERLKRIEKIIDTIQDSILRKMGDYSTNIEDIKQELIETQKSFTKLLPELKEKTNKKSSKRSK